MPDSSNRHPGAAAAYDFAASGRRCSTLNARAWRRWPRASTAILARCTLLLACRGRVVCTGMGKSGHIARKIAATLASTGTPASSCTGRSRPRDLGMVTDADVLLALSYSGESDEVLMLLPC